MEAARVIKLVGGGTDALRQAIESGVMSVEARRMAERVLKENATLKVRLKKAEEENRDLRTLNAKYRDLEMRTIKAAVDAQEGAQARKDWHMTVTVTLFAAGAIAAMLMTVAALL